MAYEEYETTQGQTSCWLYLFAAASERQTIVRGLAAINEKATYLRLVPRTGEAHYVSILRGGPKTG